MPQKTKTTVKKHTTIPPSVKAAATKATVDTKSIPAPVLAAAPVVAAVTPEVMKKDAKPAVAVAKAEAPAVIAKSDAAVDLKPLLAALHDFDADTARQAATSLGQQGDASAVEPLIEIITNANGYFHSVVRSAAASSLGQLKDLRAFDALLNAVHDSIADPSSEAIHALAALGDRRAVSTLIEVVRNRSGFFVNSVRRAAVLSLIKLGGDEAQAELRLVSSDGWEDAVIREEATAAVTLDQA